MIATNKFLRIFEKNIAMKKSFRIFAFLLLLAAGGLFSCSKEESMDLSNVIAIEIFPGDTVIEVGTSVQFTAYGLLSDSVTVVDITKDVTWGSNQPSKLSIDGDGLATAITEGEYYVVAATRTTYGTAIAVNTTAGGLVREMVLVDYEANFVGSNLANCGWTGATAGCNPGTVSQESHNKVVQRINYFRRLVGLPDNVTLNSDNSAKCQEAALIMKANNQLNHYPPSSWTCWTDAGYEGAGNSNIALGFHSTAAVAAYIDDFGANNKPVGHRRWLLYSKGLVMGHGSTDNTNAIWVMQSGGSTPSDLPEFIAYPPKGYVPAPLIYDRWSFGIPGADFSNATITMKDPANANVSCNVTSKSDTGMGDNTIVWEPADVNTSSDTDVTYTVTVGGVKIGADTKSYTYSVTIIQPDKKRPDQYRIEKAANPNARLL